MPFYLTNTLENGGAGGQPTAGPLVLAEESKLAGAVKRDRPSWSSSATRPIPGIRPTPVTGITELIEDYKMVDGQPLGERATSSGSRMDYVKFLRFAEWKIAQAGHGVVGMITNHGYLDNPTFRACAAPAPVL